jgi:hypothetical protein
MTVMKPRIRAVLSDIGAELAAVCASASDPADVIHCHYPDTGASRWPRPVWQAPPFRVRAALPPLGNQPNRGRAATPP